MSETSSIWVNARPVNAKLLDEFVKWTETASMFTSSPEGGAFGEELRVTFRLAKLAIAIMNSPETKRK